MRPFTFTVATLATAGFVAFAGPAGAQTAAKLVPAQSEITFAAKQMGVPINGAFKRFDAQVAFDPKKPEAGKIALTVDLSSATLGAPEFDAELVKPGWFDSKKNTSATFQSTSIKAAGPGRFDVAGKLTIKGNARDLTVPVTLAQAGASTTATGSFAIKRLDYKIGEGEWTDTSIVANDVQVKFKLVLTGMPAL